MDLVKAKIEQATAILKELDIDLWLLFCRESDVMADPAHELVIGHKVVWQSAFFIGRKGERIALVGSYDTADFERSGRFTDVRGYVEDCGSEIRSIIEAIGPAKIAVNFSKDDTAADGLSHGMYLLLTAYLKGTAYVERIVSAEKIISLLRGRKLEPEREKISRAATMAVEAWEKFIKMAHPGMTEIEIADNIERIIAEAGGICSFDTIVNAGSKTSPGHGHPTEAVWERGELLHIDFGIKYDGFCSDLQRLAYCRAAGETEPPPELQRAFIMIKEIIDVTSRSYKPGVKGYEIDAIARQMLRDNGYEEYQHALGHQIGRSVHDGSAIVGPRWRRYGSMCEIPLEESNVFTVELGIPLEGIGYVGLEEDLAVTRTGGEFLCPRQTELIII